MGFVFWGYLWAFIMITCIPGHGRTCGAIGCSAGPAGFCPYLMLSQPLSEESLRNASTSILQARLHQYSNDIVPNEKYDVSKNYSKCFSPFHGEQGIPRKNAIHALYLQPLTESAGKLHCSLP